MAQKRGVACFKRGFSLRIGDRWAQQVDSSWKLLVYRVQWVIFETSTSSQEKSEKKETSAAAARSFDQRIEEDRGRVENSS